MPRMFVICILTVALLATCPVPALADTNLLDDDQPAAKPVVATIYINNAKTTYDDEITVKLTERFNAKLTRYDIRKGDRYVEKLDKQGVTDISVAERADILKAFEGEGVDYVVYAEVQPPILNEWVAVFNAGYKVTVIVPVKILNVKAGRYIYNGKFTEQADNSAVIGGVGTKAAVMTALDQILAKTDEVLVNRLPIINK
ncbi:hypothetical protein [Anaeroselena agilis]|uniref:Uncharacterized protein n=1 Tax=Anaeroselena agilis TaxID=3063788 RepID=A0ABU3P4N7_9FIRM|nr:hypothetical protein [Selenomonadales bacterium 4137-cl]